MSLKRYTESVVESRGLIHQTTLRALRLYVKTTPEEMLLREIKDITWAKALRALWEAGLSSRLQAAVLEQLEKI